MPNILDGSAEGDVKEPREELPEESKEQESEADAGHLEDLADRAIPDEPATEKQVIVVEQRVVEQTSVYRLAPGVAGISHSR